MRLLTYVWYRISFPFFSLQTVNVAARIESSGRPNRIHVSESTAELLKKAGRVGWIVPRKQLVEAKGKGMLKTYWVEPRKKSSASSDNTSNSSSSENDPLGGRSDHKTARLVEWNTQVFAKLLQEIVVQRAARTEIDQSATSSSSLENRPKYQPKESTGLSLIDEVMDILDVGEPAQDIQVKKEVKALEPLVLNQLRDFIRRIALLYQPNSFHNFEQWVQPRL